MSPELSAALAELCKMGLQLLGALVVARLAVQWALTRYKSEKMWERETTAIVDVLSAIAAIEEIVGDWWDDEVTGREPEEDVQAARRERYWSERRRLRSVAAIGGVILPPQAGEILQTLIASLERRPTDYEDWVTRLDENGAALKAARLALVEFGRQRVQR